MAKLNGHDSRASAKTGQALKLEAPSPKPPKSVTRTPIPTKTSPTWTREQDTALKLVDRWFKNPKSKQCLRIDGYAGTGKTTMARHFASNISGLVMFGAYTGKAVQVLRGKGVEASTLHSLVYKAFVKDGFDLEKYELELEELEKRRSLVLGTEDARTRRKEILLAQRELRKKIMGEREEVGRLRFKLNMSSPLEKARLLVVDEHSMVDHRLKLDLMSFGCKILLLGDPGQLPPIKGEGAFMEGEPDYLLEEVHRQAADSPILHLATRARRGLPLEMGKYGDSLVTDKLDSADAMSVDQVIVGLNKTRVHCNGRIRQLQHWERLKGMLPEGIERLEDWPIKDRPRPIPHPLVGEKVVCLKNEHEAGLLNGETYTVESIGIDEDGGEARTYGPWDGFDMKVVSKERGLAFSVRAVMGAFDSEKYECHKTHLSCFDYGYAITAHKSQGSEYGSVLIFNEADRFKKDLRKKWPYTAITRARDKAIILQNWLR